MNTPALTSALIMAGLGLILAIDGLVPAPPRPGAPLSPAQRWARLTHRPTGAAGRRRDLRWGLAVLVGIVLFVLTDWVAALALGPTLLGAAPPTDIPLMEALDRWVRQVAAVLPQGRDIITAVRISRPRAPKLIAGSVDQLVSRLDGRMEPREAFQRMADELDSSEADAVLASLALAATHPRGASVTLKAIAGTIQQRLKVLRQVEAERSKPRNAVRQITLVTIAMFGVLLVVGRSFLAPLATPPGQVLVTAAVVMYVTALVQMYRMARPRRRTRIMVRRTR
ncbi:type II secretion system F family protein [Cutibacterium modestum]|uniref:type II secretion system F family protein n=1 Tax=Cutibacterium modestum TaxID=2559073 RepID=UPI0020A43F99|nr:type II secretion system F family protein [Cutibacterium modestum]MCP2378849.1 hypothetical protein [Cutibacterium modestum 31N]